MSGCGGLARESASVAAVVGGSAKGRSYGVARKCLAGACFAKTRLKNCVWLEFGVHLAASPLEFLEKYGHGR